MKLYDLVRGIGWLTLGVGLSSLFNLLFHFSMGNLLDPTDFSAIVAVLSLISLISLPLGALETETASIIAVSKFREKTPSHSQYYDRFKISPLAEFCLFIICLIISIPTLFPLIGMESFTISTFFAIMIILSSRLRIRIGIFQGFQNFNNMALISISNSTIRLFIGVAAISFLGIGLIGGFSGIFIGFLAALFISHKLSEDEPQSSNELPIREPRYFHVMLVLSLTGWIMNWDYIVATNLFSEIEIPVYAYSVVLAKVAIIFSFPIVGSLVPKMAESEDTEVTSTLFFHQIAYLLLILPFGLLLYKFEQNILELLFFNSDIDLGGSVVFKLFLGYVAVSLTLITVYAAISRGDHLRFVPLIALSLSFPFLAIYSSQDVGELANIVALCSWIIFILSIAMFSLFTRKVTLVN